LDALARFIVVGKTLYADTTDYPPLLRRAAAVQRVLAGESLPTVAADTNLSLYHLDKWVEAIGEAGLYDWLGKKQPTTERLSRARSGVAQIFLGTLAERRFESVAAQLLTDQSYRIKDDRGRRSDTDYQLVDAGGLAVCRLNVKYHGTLFRESKEYVGLEPVDCFALATYKINGALRRQEDERLPYVFLIISVPEIPRRAIEQSISDDLVWLASVSDRATEEAIVKTLVDQPWAQPVKAQIVNSEFRVLSARKAYNLMRDKLFERVHALRLRAFNRTFRGAEINMHLSFSQEMVSFAELIGLLAATGVQGLAVRLERGEI